MGSCNSLDLIDAEKSDSYFLKSGNVVFCPGGNTLAFGVRKCDADVNSLEILTRYLVKDNKDIYFKGIEQSHVDYESFYMDNELPKDKNYVYAMAKNNLKAIPNVDAHSYTLIKKDPGGVRWTKDKNNYYRSYEKVDVHYNTFEFLNTSFSRDKDSIYGWIKELGSTNSKSPKSSFQGLEKNDETVLVVNDRYIMVKDTLFYISKLENNALKKIGLPSKDGLRVLNEHILCVDDLVVEKGEKFKYKAVDSKSFELLNPNYVMKYARDKNHIYFEQEVIEQANLKAFKVLEKSFFAIDDKNVFYKKRIIEGDPKSFRKHKNVWKDDMGNIYNYKGVKQP